MNTGAFIVIVSLILGVCNSQWDYSATTSGYCQRTIESCTNTYNMRWSGREREQEYYDCVKTAPCYSQDEYNMQQQILANIRQNMNYYSDNQNGAPRLVISMVTVITPLLAALKMLCA